MERTGRKRGAKSKNNAAGPPLTNTLEGNMLAEVGLSPDARISIRFGVSASVAGIAFLIVASLEAKTVEGFLAVQIPIIALLCMLTGLLPLPAIAYGIWGIVMNVRDKAAWVGVGIGIGIYAVAALFIVL